MANKVAEEIREALDDEDLMDDFDGVIQLLEDAANEIERLEEQKYR